MSEGKLKKLSDYEWASAARYIQYVSGVAGLEEICSSSVVSFPLGTVGVDRLLVKKRRVYLLLKGNLKSIERFVGKHNSELDKNEMAVLRGVYSQYRVAVGTVEGHIDFLETCKLDNQLSLFNE